MTPITEAMVLAAGLGTRMRPLTDNLPKPMIEIAGRSMIDRALDNLIAAGVKRAVVNTFYLPSIIEEHLAKRNDIEIIFSREEERLETGGGILNALYHFKTNPIYVVGSDVVWSGNGLLQLAENWSDELVGALLLQKAAGAYGYEGAGDFDLAAGRLSWREEGKKAEFVFTGIQVLCLNVFKREAVRLLGKNFGLNKIYKQYLDEFIGIENPGKWYHIGTPQAVEKFGW